MKSERRKQIITLSILVVAVLVISVGFAAFSTILRINSSATVNPNSNTFSVKFSTTKDTLTVAAVSPSSSTSGITTTNGTIDNTTDPTISNLSAEFTSPGDYVEYTFYARNEGEFLAYLTNINYVGETSCTAGEGATDSYVQEACSAINVKVTVAGTTYTKTTGITGHTLAKNTGEEVKVRIEYSSTGAVADGPFTVTLPEITMVYASQGDSTPQLVVGCTGTTVVSSGAYTSGDLYNCNVSTSESYDFYVLSDNGDDTVTMLMANNLDGTTSWNNKDTFLSSKTSGWTLANSVAIPSVIQVGCSEESPGDPYCEGEIPTWAQGIYWTSTKPYYVESSNVFYVDTQDALDGEYCCTEENGCWYPDGVCHPVVYGVRPIITVDKDMLN